MTYPNVKQLFIFLFVIERNFYIAQRCEICPFAALKYKWLDQRTTERLTAPFQTSPCTQPNFLVNNPGWETVPPAIITAKNPRKTPDGDIF